MTLIEQKNQVSNFIKRGYEIEKQCLPKSRYMEPIISGPLFEEWINEINIFNERYLKSHPLYSQIHSTYFHRLNVSSTYERMMGHLNAVVNDKEFWTKDTPLEDGPNVESEKLVNKCMPIVFISHRSTDKDIADMLVDFFSGTGISREAIFCSSLPGNDINEKISAEVKTALKNSAVNIAVLSQDYYQSAYCLNEAGVLWYVDIPVIPIALPEINLNNMYGFLNNEYKLRRLDSDTDVSYIYDIVSEALSASHVKASVITHENNKLRARYAEVLKTRELPKPFTAGSDIIDTSEITTDDERVVLYYMLHKNVRKVSKSIITQWLNENEIYDINVDNAFDLLSSFEGGSINNDVLELGLEAFRKYSTNASSILLELKGCVDNHTKLAVNTFKIIWDSDTLDSEIGLFIAYIVDEKMCSFGARWMADTQIENINQWQRKNSLDSALSSNYGGCLTFFIQNDFVYESDWTSYGNPREYSLCPSLQEFLFNCPSDILEELQKIKNHHSLDLPF